MGSAVRGSVEPDPALVWDTLNAHQRTAALRAAIDLDLFTAIGEGAETIEAIAARCKSSSRGVRILCDYLTVIGFLSKQDSRYQLSPTSAAFLDRRSPASMATMVHFLNTPKILAAFKDLAETVRRGTTLLPDQGMIETELEEWVVFAKSMMPIVRNAAEFIGDIALQSGNPIRRVLDIAAGHGLFGIAVARRAPGAEIVALDWPNVLEVARENARVGGVSQNYRLLPGDAFTVDYGGGYDIVLLTNLLHHFDEKTCAALLKKIHGSMNAGARLLTLEFIPNEDRVTPPIPAAFSMIMLALTPAGDAYTMEQYDKMLVSAGFSRNELLQVPKSPQQLIVSTK